MPGLSQASLVLDRRVPQVTSREFVAERLVQLKLAGLDRAVVQDHLRVLPRIEKRVERCDVLDLGEVHSERVQLRDRVDGLNGAHAPAEVSKIERLERLE